LNVLLTVIGAALVVVWIVETIVLLVSYRSSGRKSGSAAKHAP